MPVNGRNGDPRRAATTLALRQRTDAALAKRENPISAKSAVQKSASAKFEQVQRMTKKWTATAASCQCAQCRLRAALRERANPIALLSSGLQGQLKSPKCPTLQYALTPAFGAAKFRLQMLLAMNRGRNKKVLFVIDVTI